MSKQSKLYQQIYDFLDYMEVERNCSQLTLRNYRHYLDRFVTWFEHSGYGTDLSQLSLEVVRKYRLFLARFQDTKKNNLSLVTQSYHVIALRSFLKWAIKNDIKTLAPEKIDLPRGKSRSLKFLRQDQIDKLVNQPDIETKAGLRDRAILELLFSTGLRVSELVKLDRDRIDFETLEFGIIGKGGRARVVFLSHQAAQWLKRYFDRRKDTWKPAFVRYAKNQKTLDPDGLEMRLSVRAIQRIVEKYRRLAKIPVDITPHGLRHTFATDLIFHGAGLREVQEMLGHKNISTTQIYTHVTNPQLKKVHEKYHRGNQN